MKKKIAVGIGVVLLIAALFIAIKPSSFEKKANKTLGKLSSYKLEGNMEITSGEDIKSYVITSSWMKDKDNQEFFKVSMVDKSLNQEQIILKNSEGVFVITPSLNQIFKFQGEWPTNSPKPYLLQTMIDILNSEHKMSKAKDGYLVTAPCNYTSASQLVDQEIKFNKEIKPQYLIAYNQDKVAELKMDFTKVSYNEGFETGYFDTPKTNIETPTSAYNGLVDLPLYPMAVFDSKLVSNSVSSIDGENQHILEFVGSKDFTVVQKEKKASKDLTVTEVNGQLVDDFGLLGYYDGNKLTVINSQIEYTVYSDDLTAQEMLQVVQSMQVSVMK